MPIKYWKDEAPPKGVSNRNEAFKWLIQHLNNDNNNNAGVVYIADDDNTYDLDLFVEVVVSTKLYLKIPLYMDKLQLTGRNLGRVFNSRSGCACSMQLSCFETKLPNLMLKTWPKPLLGSLLLDIVLPTLY